MKAKKVVTHIIGKRIAPVVLCSCILISGCGATETSEEVGSVSEQFDTFTDELFLEEISANTVDLHYTLAYPENYGIDEYEVTIGDITLEDMEESYEELEDLKKELEKFDKKELTEEQCLTYDILMDYIDTELSVKDLALYTEYLGPLSGYQAQLPVILAEYTFREKRDVEDYLTLVSQLDDLFGQILVFEKEKADAGLFMPDYVADEVIEQCEEFIADPENNYMIDVFNDKIDAFEGLTEEERQDYKDQNFTTITTEVVDGYQKLIDGLTELKGSGTNELGLCYYEDGTRYYEYLVRSTVGTDRSIDELMTATEDYIESGYEKLFSTLSSDSELFDELMDYSFPITEPEAIMEDLIEKVAEDFPEPPEVNYSIKYVHPSMQESMSPAFYLTTPVDDVKNNVIYINEKYLGEDASMDLYPTMAHEGYPGHLYQTAYTNSSDLPLVRNLLSTTGFVEGWTTYVEFDYAYSISGLDKRLARCLALDESVIIGMHAYIDMGIHYKGWDRDDVLEYLDRYGLGDEETADRMFEAMVEDPASYLSYFIGYLEFRNLRNHAEKALGDDFEVKEFHRFLLETGAAPFYIIEDYMQNWIEEQKSAS